MAVSTVAIKVLACPRCRENVEVQAGQKAYCTTCGYPKAQDTRWAIPADWGEGDPEYRKYQRGSHSAAYAVGGVASGLVALAFFPPIFALVGIGCGIKAMVDDNPWGGMLALGVSVLGGYFGMIWGAMAAMRSFGL